MSHNAYCSSSAQYFGKLENEITLYTIISSFRIKTRSNDIDELKLYKCLTC